MNLFREMLLNRDADDLGRTMADVALRIRRAGLEHLVRDLKPEEVEPTVAAMAAAGEELARERAALLVVALHDPAEIVAPYDGGAARHASMKSAALAAAGVSRG